MASATQKHNTRLAGFLVVVLYFQSSAEKSAEFLTAENSLWIAIMAEIQLLHTLKYAFEHSRKLTYFDSQLSLQNIYALTESKSSSVSSVSQFLSPEIRNFVPINNQKSFTFPHELIVGIVRFVPYTSLYNCALVSRAWNSATTPILFGNPFLPSITSISKFLNLVEQYDYANNGLFADFMHWDYPKIPKTITFTRLFPETTITPTEDPAGLNLAGLNFSNKSFRKEDILKSQSSLFRLFVLDRTNPDWSFVHPIISRLVKVCTKLNEAHEFVDLKNNEKIIPKRNTNTIQTITSQPIVSTNPAQLQAASVSSSSLPSLPTASAKTSTDAKNVVMDPNKLLTNLIKLSKHVIAQCNDLGLLSDSIIDKLLLFLGLFESRDKSMWVVSKIDNRTFRGIKAMVFEKLKSILNAISTCILIEVQYVTVSSQRLLDSYCMMYYRTLAHANALNLTIVLKVLQIAARELSISSQQPSLTSIPTAPATKLSHRILQAIQLMFHRNLFNLPRQSVSRSTTSSINNVGNENGEQNTATGIPHTNVPAETFEDSLGGLLSSHTALREGLMSFAPGSMNSETAEFIEELLNFGSCVDENPGKIFSGNSSSNGIDGKSIQHEADAMHDEENFEIFKCMGWMREVIKWQRAGRQMEPVKDLLRRSMGRIDRLRGVQRKFGLYFMD